MLATFKKLPRKKQVAILDAAANVFASKGYYQANVETICRKAGISNGALYKYFKNKEDLFVSVFDRIVRIFSIDPRRFSSKDKSVYEKLQDLLNDIVRVAENHRDYIAVYFELGLPSMSKMAPYLSERIEEPAKAQWLNLVKEGKIRGEIDQHIDSKVASFIIDNHVMLFMFSCISDHYDRRFNSYFGKKGKIFSNQDKIQKVLASIKMLLTRGDQRDFPVQGGVT
jgi:TetR/AcrR family transcriptional regulator